MSEKFSKGKPKTSDEQLDALLDTSLQQAETEEQSPGESSEYETDSKGSEQELFQAEVSLNPPKVTLVKQTQKQGENPEELETLMDPPHQSEQRPGTGELQLKNPDRGEETSMIEGMESPVPGDGSLEEVLETVAARLRKGSERREDLATKGIQPDVFPDVFENRDIFETGGEQPGVGQHTNRETSEAEENAETFSGDIPVSEEEQDLVPLPRRCCRCPMAYCLRRLLTDFWERVTVWWELSTCRNTLIESSTHFVVAAVTCVICLILAHKLGDEQKDVPICIFAVIMSCCANTLTCKRFWLDYRVNSTGDGQEELTAVYDCSSILRNMCCDCCFCCFGNLDMMPQRRRWYTRRRGNFGTDTAFVHEVVDVSGLDPRHCPQIRHVDNEVIYESIPPDFKSAIEKADAVVHTTETSTEPGDEFICEHHSQNVACGCSSLDANTKPKVEGIFSKCPVQDLASASQRQGGRIVTYPGPSQKAEPKSKSSSDDDVFICEHFGQAVACACPELARKKKKQARPSSLLGKAYMCERCRDVACTCPDLAQEDESGTSTHAVDDEPPVCHQCGPGVACACPELAQKERTKFKYPPQRSASDDDVFFPERHGQDAACPESAQNEKDPCKGP